MQPATANLYKLKSHYSTHSLRVIHYYKSPFELYCADYSDDIINVIKEIYNIQDWLTLEENVSFPNIDTLNSNNAALRAVNQRWIMCITVGFCGGHLFSVRNSIGTLPNSYARICFTFSMALWLSIAINDGQLIVELCSIGLRHNVHRNMVEKLVAHLSYADQRQNSNEL